jgi:uncharacterized membrane protein
MEIFGRQFEILQPAWLAGLALLPLVAVYCRWSLAGLSRGRQALLLSARVLLLLALVASLCDLEVTWPSGRQMVVFALDQSASIAESSRHEAEAFLAQAASQAGGNRVACLPFAASAGPVQAELPRGTGKLDRQGTNLAAAVTAARAQIPADYVPRIVLLSDGNQTEGDVLRAVRSAGVPIDVVPLASAGPPEVYVAAMEAPGQVKEGVPFGVDVLVHSDHDDEGTVELSQSAPAAVTRAHQPAWPPGLTTDVRPLAPAATPADQGQEVVRQKVKILRGDNRIPFTCTINGKPSALFTARIESFRDTIAENNSATAMVFSTGRPKALVLARDASSVQHLGPILTGQRIDFDFRPTLGAGPQAGLPRTLEELQNYDLLMLVNVPAADLPQDRQETLQRYVRDFGGGLVVIGGDQAFTPGGYHGTTLEEVLPVWCDFHRRQPRPSLAMVLVLDRSGSMEGSAIRLAKEAIRRAVEMLEPGDQVGVLVFDDTTRWISPIAPCLDKRPILAEIATITAGGETDMGPAMDKAYLALNECFAQMKHVIIMTDGVSHPGDFEGQAKKMADAGITVSMVALGQQAARPEAEDIARLGKGHHYFCVDPADIPRIFALDTASASRMGIVEQPFFPTLVGPSLAIAASEIRTAPSLLGYVGTRPKPTSQLILSSLEGDPLLIWWRYGRGVSVAFTSDLQSRWAAPWLRWQGLGRFWGQLVRHALPGNQPRDFALDLKRRGTRIELSLDAVDPAGAPLNGAKVSLHVVGPRAVRDLDVPQVAPGRYAARLDAATEGTCVLELRVEYQGRQVHFERRGLVAGFADELRVRPADEPLLRSIASLSGGRYRPQAAAIFRPSSRTVPRTEALWRYLLTAAVVILLVDVAVRRTVRNV